MMDLMAHSGRRAHVWKFRAAWFRQMLITHGWSLRGAYASKCFGGQEYMMTRVRDEGEILVYRICRKEDHWSDISHRERDREAAERRKHFRVVGRDEAPDVKPPVPERWSCLPGKTLDEIRAEMMREFPGTTIAELEAMGC